MKQQWNRSLAVVAVSCLAGLPLAAQELERPSVPRFDFFAGYAYFNSPKLSLPEHGFHLQGGVNVKRWLALGVDYSRAEGTFSLTPNLLTANLRGAAEEVLTQWKAGGYIPQNYSGAVPTSVTTQTFAAGPQLVWRHRGWALTFGPSLGWVLEKATTHPIDDVTTFFVSSISDNPTSTDHNFFYGGGAAVDINATRHLGLRVRVDVVHDTLFTSSYLAEGRNTVRVSIGPSFHFGKSLR